jgi:hypothetical protein
MHAFFREINCFPLEKKQKFFRQKTKMHTEMENQQMGNFRGYLSKSKKIIKK